MTHRQIHRWMSIVGIAFFLVVATTGVWMQGAAIFGEDEAEREALAEQVSLLTLAKPMPLDAAQLDRARAATMARFGNRPVAGVDWLIKAPVPAFVFHLDGAEPIKVTVNAATASIIKSQADHESWVMKLHTGELLGDGGKFLGLAWGLALIAMSLTGIVLYFQMLAKRKSATGGRASGWRRYFW